MSDPIPENVSPDEERSVYDEDEPIQSEDIRESDAALSPDALPMTHDDDPLLADLGAQGQGDLAPEDDPRLRGQAKGPDDLRSEQ